MNSRNGARRQPRTRQEFDPRLIASSSLSIQTLLRQNLFVAMVVSTVAAVLIFRRVGIHAESWDAYTYFGATALLFIAEQIIPRNASWLRRQRSKLSIQERYCGPYI